MTYNIIRRKTHDARMGKGVIMKCKNIETVVMHNNHLGREAAIADTFGVTFSEYVATYDEETNCTTIHYISYKEW